MRWGVRKERKNWEKKRKGEKRRGNEGGK